MQFLPTDVSALFSCMRRRSDKSATVIGYARGTISRNAPGQAGASANGSGTNQGVSEFQRLPLVPGTRCSNESLRPWHLPVNHTEQDVMSAVGRLIIDY